MSADRSYGRRPYQGADALFFDAVDAINAVRDENPTCVLRRYEQLAKADPRAAARLVMALAASVPETDTLETLARRHEAVARDGIAAINHRFRGDAA